MKYLMTGSYGEALEQGTKEGIENWVWIGGIEDIEGKEEITLIFGNSFWMHPRVKEIMEYIDKSGIRVNIELRAFRGEELGRPASQDLSKMTLKDSVFYLGDHIVHIYKELNELKKR